ncbi:MAG: transcriptional repressor [Lentimicrobium sp.]|nr:transcriptional repressor [Lentimicrobium sp.]
MNKTGFKLYLLQTTSNYNLKLSLNMELIQNIVSKLSDAGLKITPQRVAVMKTLLEQSNHPTADELFNEISKDLPGLSPTTIYNTLDTFVEKGLIRRVKTDADVMRYDAVTEHHHHLYCAVSDRMEDYFDPELDQMLLEYFRKKQIKGFTVSDIRLQLMGDFEQKK